MITEKEKIKEYKRLIKEGLSDYEARATVWGDEK